MHRAATRVAARRRGVVARLALAHLLWRMRRYPTASEPVLLVMDTARDPRVSERAGAALERGWADGQRGEIWTAISMSVRPAPPHETTNLLRRIVRAYLTDDHELLHRLDPTGRVAVRHLQLGYSTRGRPGDGPFAESWTGYVLGSALESRWNVDQERQRELARRQAAGHPPGAGFGGGGGGSTSGPGGISGSDYGGGHASHGGSF